MGLNREHAWGKGGVEGVLRSARQQSYGGSWVTLEHIYPPGTNVLPFAGVEADLPEGVRVARLVAHALTPSITLIVAQFVLHEDVGLRMDRVARRIAFEPRGRITETGGVSFEPEVMVKEAEIRATRQQLRELGASWMREHLPGAFGASLGGLKMPTAELVTTELALPFARGERSDYRSTAGFGYDPGYFVSSKHFPGWRLVVGREEPVMTIAGRREDVLAEDRYTTYNVKDDETGALTYVAQQALDKNLVLWGASRLLRGYQARLAQIRDDGLRGGTSSLAAARRLKRVRSELLRDSLDARVAAAELRRLAANERDFEWGASEWVENDELQNEQEPVRRWLELTRDSVRFDARALEETEQRVRDALVIDSSAVSALSNLRLQTEILVISIVATVIAVISLLIAIR